MDNAMNIKWKNKKLKYIFYVVLVFVLAGIFCEMPGYATVNGGSEQSNFVPQWKYIVIHHSATNRGNAAMFARYHTARGMQNGLAYHFVIDNGTCGKLDGQLEIGSRWKKQLPGGHCKQQWVNESGIGICLVGNFNKGRPSARQLRTLTKLVNALMKKYNIPIKRVVGHGKIKGEQSQCPGKYFPWRDFYSDIEGTK